MGVGSQPHTPTALPPVTRYPLYRRPGGSRVRSRLLRKISLQPGFDPRTVQPVASRYTNYAIPAHVYLNSAKGLFEVTATDRAANTRHL
jgi:hypothetical protein